MVHTPNGNCIRVTGLKANEFGKPFVIHIGATAELTYSGYTYLYTVAREQNTTATTVLKNLATGVYRYAAACEANFATNA
jgi:hypothetical protein